VAASEAVRLTLELADALGHAHGQGVVHRDVSPENIVLAAGHALLTNLGVARALDDAGVTALTDTGLLVGSAAYVSPEQAEGKRSIDRRTDIYALGAVLFEMLAGEPLFSGPTLQAIMAKRAADPMPTARMAAIPPEIRPVLRKALAPDRERRYGSMGEFASALSKSLQGEARPSQWADLFAWLRTFLPGWIPAR
jgi:serine/threonine-protein kinase